MDDRKKLVLAMAVTELALLECALDHAEGRCGKGEGECPERERLLAQREEIKELLGILTN